MAKKMRRTRNRKVSVSTRDNNTIVGSRTSKTTTTPDDGSLQENDVILERTSVVVSPSLSEQSEPEPDCSMEALVLLLRQDNHRLRLKCNQSSKRLQIYRDGGQNVLNFSTKFGSMGTCVRAWLAAVSGFAGRELSDQEYEMVIASTLILLCEFDSIAAPASDKTVYTPACKEVRALYENIMKKMGICATATLDAYGSFIKTAGQGTSNELPDVHV